MERQKDLLESGKQVPSGISKAFWILKYFRKTDLITLILAVRFVKCKHKQHHHPKRPMSCLSCSGILQKQEDVKLTLKSNVKVSFFVVLCFTETCALCRPPCRNLSTSLYPKHKGRRPRWYTNITRSTASDTFTCERWSSHSRTTMTASHRSSPTFPSLT